MSKKTKNKAKRVHNLIIVDESGSMQDIQKQAFSGMNETLQTVRRLQAKYPDMEQRVSLVTFNSAQIKWHYDNELAELTKDLDWSDYNPSACTPLYDAMGRAMSKVEAQIEEGSKVLATVITDGYENSSKEWTSQMIRATIDRLKELHWTFSLIGTDNLDVESMARSFKIDNHLSFRQDGAGTKKMFSKVLCCVGRAMDLLEEDEDIPTGGFFTDDEDIPTGRFFTDDEDIPTGRSIVDDKDIPTGGPFVDDDSPLPF